MQSVSLDLAGSRRSHPLFARLEALGIPGNKTEHYRRFAVKPLLNAAYDLVEVHGEHAAESGAVLRIENGEVVEVPAGVSVSFADPFEADENHFDALYFLTHLAAPKVICLEIGRDADIEIVHRFEREKALLPYRLCVTVAPGVKAKVFESFETAGSTSSLMLYGIDARIETEATLRWVRDQNGSASECAVIGSHRYDVAARGALELKTFDFGSAKALHLYKIDLDEYAWCDAEHLLLASHDARRGNVVQINHNRPYAKSAQNARNILKDEATGIFDGLIRVGHDARYTSAHQNSKAILLGEHAFMYAKPQLEIYTDELEASHGSTTGELDEDALFYLRSRGIEHDEAQKMLVLAFANALIDTAGDDNIVERIRTDFEAAYFEHA